MRQILIGCHRPITHAMCAALAHPEEVVFFVGSLDAFDRVLAVEAIDRIFLIFWSWRIPADVIERYKPVGFHMTSLPFGRGGHPLQNLIESGNAHTELCMLVLDAELDAGAVLDRQPLCIEGPADEIYARGGLLACQRIRAYLDAGCSWPAIPQQGIPVEFQRRTPAMSELPREGGLEGLLRHIRMLDAEGYPHAFIEYGAFRLELRRATLRADRVLTDCKISVRD